MVSRFFDPRKILRAASTGALAMSGGTNGSRAAEGRAESQKLAEDISLPIVLDEVDGQRDTDMTPQLTDVRQSDAQAFFTHCRHPALDTHARTGA